MDDWTPDRRTLEWAAGLAESDAARARDLGCPLVAQEASGHATWLRLLAESGRVAR